MKKFLQNFISFPLKSHFVFQNLEKIFNKNSGGFILCFHDLSPNVFESQVKSLSPAKPIPLDELIERYKSGKSTKNCFSITFDDGVRNTVIKNTEVCSINNWPVTFYLPINYVNGELLPYQKIELIEKFLKDDYNKISNDYYKKEYKFKKKRLIKFLREIIYVESKEKVDANLNYFLNKIPNITKAKQSIPKAINWSEIKELSKNPLVSFQSHGLSHTACSALNENDLRREMLESKKIIEESTNKRVNSFCYPYGEKRSISKLSIEIASKYFETATTLISGKINKNNLHYLPRIGFYQENKNSFVRLKVILR